MSIFSGTPETLASVVADGVEAKLRAAVRTKLMEVLTPLVEDTAREVCAALIHKVTAYHDHAGKTVEVLVNFTPRATEAINRVAHGR